MVDVQQKRGVSVWWWILGILAVVLIVVYLVVFMGEDPDVVEPVDTPAAEVEPVVVPTEPAPVTEPMVTP